MFLFSSKQTNDKMIVITYQTRTAGAYSLHVTAPVGVLGNPWVPYLTNKLWCFSLILEFGERNEKYKNIRTVTYMDVCFLSTILGIILGEINITIFYFINLI